MKYLKKFQTNADYQAFRGGGDWITPNVSVIVEDDTIMFEPAVNAVPLITFTIDNVEYQAEEGMTWGEWCNSEYNVDGFICDFVNIWTSSKSRRLYCQCVSDVICNGCVYFTIQSSGGSDN